MKNFLRIILVCGFGMFALLCFISIPQQKTIVDSIIILLSGFVSAFIAYVFFCMKSKTTKNSVEDAMNANPRINAKIEEVNSDFIKQVDVNPTFIKPDFDLSVFPFYNREYVCTGTAYKNIHNGEIFNECLRYYATDDVMYNVVNHIIRLEKMLTEEKLGIKGLPPLSTNYDLFEPVDELLSIDKLPQNYVAMTLKPLTKTGKKAKYPVEVFFNAYRRKTYDDASESEYFSSVGQEGSHGTLSFLQDGEIGKASIFYWEHHKCFAAYFKLFNDTLALNVLTYKDVNSGIDIEIYRHE
ncbi:MAG: hypothetical protein E7A81_07060 [Clostridiales bacterium]|nr:hypothetical protein [Clostridiales bacterium]